MKITDHAVARYQERIDPALTAAQARAAILSHGPVVKKAAAFGCRTVRMGNGGKLVLDGTRVVTVLAKGWASRDLLTPVVPA